MPSPQACATQAEAAFLFVLKLGRLRIRGHAGAPRSASPREPHKRKRCFRCCLLSCLFVFLCLFEVRFAESRQRHRQYGGRADRRRHLTRTFFKRPSATTSIPVITTSNYLDTRYL